MADSALAFVTNASDGTVSSFRLDPDGSLARVAVSPVGAGCSTLVVDAARRRVYVAVKEPARILTTAIQDDGSLRILAEREAPDSLHYLALTQDGTTMLAASYGGGFGMALPVNDDGVGAPASRVDHPNIHSCALSPDDRYAYFVSLGADLIAQCALDGTRLVALDPATVAAPQGSGPRHLVVNRAGDAIYVLTEFSGEVLHYRRAADGTLTPVGAVSAVDPSKGLQHSRFGVDPAAEQLIWGADLHIWGDQQVLWASERTASTIATIPVGADGSLGPARQFVETETQPRGFAVSPDNRFVLCAGERSTQVSLFVVDEDWGTLTRLTRQETGHGANWVRFLPL